MRLDLRFTYRPPEGLYCQAIVIFSFNIHDGLSRVLKNIDKRMAGSISSMINNGFWSGEFGEKLLFATQEALNADKLLLYGMGAEPEYSLGVLKKGVSLLGASLVRLGTSDFIIYLPVSERLEAGYLMHLETAIKT
ncbi:MAG: hypothetical protein GX846_06975, partial [Deltaproteobacteria bacterium]|nr:hypothetical protein [Deltaproteobacteria bacterium]